MSPAAPHLAGQEAGRIEPPTTFVFNLRYIESGGGVSSANKLMFACRTSDTPAVPIKPGARSISFGFT